MLPQKFLKKNSRKEGVSLSKLRSRHKFTLQEINLIKKAYDNGIKRTMPYYNYLIFLDINANEIKSLLRKIHKPQKKLRGGFLSLILSAIAAISAAASTAAPVIASAVTAAAPIIAGAGLASATEILVEKIADK